MPLRSRRLTPILSPIDPTVVWCHTKRPLLLRVLFKNPDFGTIDKSWAGRSRASLSPFVADIAAIIAAWPVGRDLLSR
jgi:hypothetical protein